MSRSSDRAQVDPLVALVGVAAVGLGLSLYAGVVADTLEEPTGRAPTDALDAVHDRTAPNGVVDPGRLDGATAWRGKRVNATLRTRNGRWSVGPVPPRTADSAARRVSVRRGPARIKAGRLRVSVW
ncbi:DUF7285 family protein [Halorarius halobius]|uniref:DUF7285 family protein n=1 Tax=Halorarius halobius TaxID=2962671 RepID=UPI0020CE900E|nr:hypothetical protein [Halorarius halobius]